MIRTSRSVLAGAVLALAAGTMVGLAPPALPAPVPTGLDYTVRTGATVSLCGSHSFGTLTIESGGTLRVADAVSAATTTPTGPDCQSGSDVNELRIRADRIVNHGRIDADARQAEPFTPDPLCPESNSYSPATGNSGGPHVGPGGRGSSGDGGTGYDLCTELPANGVFPDLNQGAPGAGSGPGGRGGGLLVLVGRAEFVSDGEISADGEDGTANITGACAFDEQTTSVVVHHTNTGTAAPRGGGAGGSIIIASRSVDFRGTSMTELHAAGGDGGNSRRGASGGGANGFVWVTGPLVAGSVVAVGDGGEPGVNLCAGDGESSGAQRGSGSALAMISQAIPTIASHASPGGLAGTPVHDVASVHGGLDPTGTVTFRLFSDPSCTVQVFSSTVPVVDGTATSGSAAPASAGTYYWTADYSGDTANMPVTSPCGAPNESVTVGAFQAPPFTRTVTGDLMGPLAVGAGQSVLITDARVVGPVTVAPGGALTVVNSRLTGGITADAPAFLSLCGAQVAAPASGVALAVTHAAVPIRVGDPATGCAGNRFAGRVTLTGNVALTFGANTVSTNATLDGNGPGQSVVKANNVFGALGCAGNAPAPTNAGQPNTGATKTGQCASL
jgi:hypothetical protein